MLMKNGMFLRCLIVFTLLFSGLACSNEPTAQDDLSLAKEAMESREWFYAERLLERYLNNVDDIEKRWEAWQALIITGEHAGTHYSVMRLYYDNMLQEFLDDNAKKKVVLLGLTQLLEDGNDYDAATDMWNVYLSIDNLSTEEVFAATRRVVEIYLHTGQFESAENSLYNCLGLEISAEDSAICLYELADLKAGRGALQEASDLALQVLDLETYADTRGKAAFLLGDIAEQQEKFEEAHKFFEQAKELYPNVLAVENRIAFLDNLMKNK